MSVKVDEMPKLYRVILLVLLSILSIFILAVFVGCGNGEENGKIEDSDRLVIGSPWFMERLDPVRDATISLRLGLLDTLVDVDYNGELVPGLARDWEVSEDGLVWTFELREDVFFHDETHMDGKAVENSLVRLKEEGVLFEDVPIEEIRVVDTYTLEISTGEYFAPMPSYLTKGETAPVSENSYNDDGEFKELLATGPYKFENWELGQQITIVRNNDYWGNTAEVEKIVYKKIPEASTRIMMLRNEELDIAQILPADTVEELKTYNNIDIHTEPILRARTLTFNKHREPFDELEVRKAINHAIDREALVEYIMAGIDKSAKGPFPKVSKWANEDIEGYNYDLDKAEQFFEEAGLEKDDEGYWTVNGEKLSIDLVTYPERAELPDMAEVIHSQLGEIGIEVNLNIVEYGQAEDLRNSGNFDLYLMGRNLGFIPDPGLYLMEDYHSKNTEGSGYGAYGYANDELDEILEKAEASKDLEERRRLYKKAQEIIVSDAPVAFLSHYVNVDASRSRVQGYQMHPLEITFGLENLTLE